jgi:hypothetical protein
MEGTNYRMEALGGINKNENILILREKAHSHEKILILTRKSSFS